MKSILLFRSRKYSLTNINLPQLIMRLDENSTCSILETVQTEGGRKVSRKLKKILKYSKHKEIKSKKAYDKYDDCDAIQSDYDDIMGVPISFLDKYNPEQFEIIGASDNGVVDEKYKLPHFKKHNEPCVGGNKRFERIFIKHKKK